MSSAISRAEVEHLAQLARIDLSSEELDRFAAQLPAILDHVAVVQSAAADAQPMSHPSGVENVFRPDEVRESLTAAEALAGAPESEDQRFMVPKILGED